MERLKFIKIVKRIEDGKKVEVENVKFIKKDSKLIPALKEDGWKLEEAKKASK